MKISIIEFLVHGETIDSLCQMLENTDATVTFLVSPKIYNELQNQPYLDKYKWVLKPENKGISEFLAEQQDFLDSQDYIIFNTVQQYFTEYFQFDFKATTILRVHNLNFMFKPLQLGGLFRSQSFDSLKFKVKRLVVERDWYHVGQMLKWIDFVSFPSEALEVYARRNGMLPPEKICPVIPLACSKRELPLPSNHSDTYKITIPGEVTLQRKDYKVVLEAFRQLVPQLTKKVVLTFLGKKGTQKRELQIIEELYDLQNDNFSFVSFDSRVSQQAFNEVMANTDLLLAPIIPTFYSPSSIEYYGRTKISGSISDIIKHNKPSILPDFYPLNEQLAKVVKLYNNATDLVLLLLDNINNPNHFSQENLQELHEAYHPDHLGHGIIHTLESLNATV